MALERGVQQIGEPERKLLRNLKRVGAIGTLVFGVTTNVGIAISVVGVSRHKNPSYNESGQIVRQVDNNDSNRLILRGLTIAEISLVLGVPFVSGLSSALITEYLLDPKKRRPEQAA